MRNLFFLLIALAIHSQAQSYTVIHTIGKIYNESGDSYLKKGSRLDANAQLKFETKGARAAALSSTRGRFVIQQTKATTAKSDAAYALSSVISPVRGRLSTRAGGINNALDFKKHFSESPVAWLGDEYVLKVSAESYPISDQQFFYAQYMLDGEAINKKLGGTEGKLVIDINEFYAVDGNAVEPAKVEDIKLHYYDASAQTSTFITEMNVSYLTDDELESLRKQFPEDNGALLEVIHALYGKCSEEQLLKSLEGL